MRNHVALLLIFVAFPLAGFVCEGVHSPVLQNNLGQPVEINATYSNGQSFSGQFPPGARISSPHEGLRLTRLEVVSEGKVLLRFDSDDLDRLQANIPPGQRIAWAIEHDGIRPVPLEQ